MPSLKSLAAVATALSASTSMAYPSYAIERMANADPKSIPKLLEEARAKRSLIGNVTSTVDGVLSTFDPAAQYIDVTGAHTFVPPDLAAGDQRGPCPGLNALANHNFLPHNGVASAVDIIAATNTVYGMSLDLGGFLAVYGTVFDGNSISLNPGYSIGGPTDQSQNILGNVAGLIGNPQGLIGSHNKYESDTSPTRGDLYTHGDNYKLVLDYFEQYYYALPENTPADQQYEALIDLRISRFNDSVYNNPYFFYSPFSGILVSPAGYSFPKAMMANHSEEYPSGYLSREVFSSFFAVTGTAETGFVYNEGHEQIPNNWYRRPLTDEYSIPSFLVDVLDFATQYPPLLDVAANTGEPNTLTPIDIADLTGGVFNSATLAEGNNLECFVYQTILAAAPDLLDGTYSDTSAALAPLSATIASSLVGLGCPQLNQYNTKMYEAYPGYTMSGGAV